MRRVVIAGSLSHREGFSSRYSVDRAISTEDCEERAGGNLVERFEVVGGLGVMRVRIQGCRSNNGGCAPKRHRVAPTLDEDGVCESESLA